MKIDMNTTVKGILLACGGIITVMVPYYWLLGQLFPFNLMFWFVFVPLLAAWLPLLIKKERNHLWEAVGGLCLFYSLIFFMIYKHYKSETFAVVMFSAAFNILLLSAIGFARKFKPAQESV